jgi:acyl dehydratase
MHLKNDGFSGWILVDQAMIDAFAEATGDRQFIHIDPAAAAQTPFGGTIAHGLLTLSLLPAMAAEVLERPAETQMSVNYGFDRVRFVAPVRSGARIRGHFALNAYDEQKPGRFQARLAVTVEIEGEEKPALAADWLTLVFV